MLGTQGFTILCLFFTLTNIPKTKVIYNSEIIQMKNDAAKFLLRESINSRRDCSSLVVHNEDAKDQITFNQTCHAIFAFQEFVKEIDFYFISEFFIIKRVLSHQLI